MLKYPQVDSHAGTECGFSSTSVQDLTKQQASHKSKKNVLCVKSNSVGVDS